MLSRIAHLVEMEETQALNMPESMNCFWPSIPRTRADEAPPRRNESTTLKTLTAPQRYSLPF